MQTPWLDWSISKIGIKETPGAGNTKEIVDWGKSAGIDWWHQDADAWCAVFVNGALVSNGYPSTKSALARSFINYGTKLDRPVPGAIVVFPRGNNPLYGHVGIVEHVRSDGTIVIVNGNVSDMVKRSTYRISSILPNGIRWPPGAPAPRGAAEIVEDDSLASRTVRVGSRGNDVRALQVSLTKLGYNAGTADGIFGWRTENAVRAFQEASGISVDGIAGQATFAALDEATADAEEKEEVESIAKKARPGAAVAGGAGVLATGGVIQAAGAAQSVKSLNDGTMLGVILVAAILIGVIGFFAWRYVPKIAGRL